MPEKPRKRELTIYVVRNGYLVAPVIKPNDLMMIGEQRVAKSMDDLCALLGELLESPDE